MSNNTDTDFVPSIFDGPRVCPECHRSLPQNYTDTVCPACKERILFSNVKDYIRANDVTEFMVADHFEIPLHKVKGWIREGRIEYKDVPTPTIESLHCKNCGTPIQFGNLCSKCQRLANTTGTTGVKTSSEEDRFRFLKD